MKSKSKAKKTKSHSQKSEAPNRKARASSRRAESLAKRIEQGAAGLAVFVETLSETEWSTPVSPTDRRPVALIVHHVAAVYPI